MDNLAKRVSSRIQLTSDGHRPYVEAVEGAFGADIDYAIGDVVRMIEAWETSQDENQAS
jgi:hypothetical protein